MKKPVLEIINLIAAYNSFRDYIQLHITDYVTLCTNLHLMGFSCPLQDAKTGQWVSSGCLSPAQRKAPSCKVGLPEQTWSQCGILPWLWGCRVQRLGYSEWLTKLHVSSDFWHRAAMRHPQLHDPCPKL